VDTLRKDSGAAASFLDKGSIPKLGKVIRQPDLARTYELLARDGMQAFYAGPLARRLVEGVRKLGGIWTGKDLADYRAIERPPIVGHYRDATIISASPPASGGVALVDALNILSEFDLEHLDSTTRKHAIIEAMRRVHRDRAVYMGDPDSVKMPIERLISPYYADGQRASIRLDRATPSSALPGVETNAGGSQTTHFSILDADGNRVAATITVNLGFGTGLVIPGTGIFLNNEMDDFSTKPGQPNAFQLIGGDANAIAPGKRMLSSMTPTIVAKDGKAVLVTGSPGSRTIINTVLCILVNVIDFNMDIRSAIDAPRLHHSWFPDEARFESTADHSQAMEQLRKMGHIIVGTRQGDAHSIWVDSKTARYFGAADHRIDGKAAGY